MATTETAPGDSDGVSSARFLHPLFQQGAAARPYLHDGSSEHAKEPDQFVGEFERGCRVYSIGLLKKWMHPRRPKRKTRTNSIDGIKITAILMPEPHLGPERTVRFWYERIGRNARDGMPPGATTLNPVIKTICKRIKMPGDSIDLRWGAHDAEGGGRHPYPTGYPFVHLHDVRKVVVRHISHPEVAGNRDATRMAIHVINAMRCDMYATLTMFRDSVPGEHPFNIRDAAEERAFRREHVLFNKYLTIKAFFLEQKLRTEDGAPAA